MKLGFTSGPCAVITAAGTGALVWAVGLIVSGSVVVMSGVGCWLSVVRGQLRVGEAGCCGSRRRLTTDNGPLTDFSLRELQFLGLLGGVRVGQVRVLGVEPAAVDLQLA